SRVSCPAATTDPSQAAYDSLKTRLGGDIANALTAQHRLSATLDQFAGIEQSLSSEVAQEEALIASLEAEIARLDAEIADTEARIEVEKQQLAAMSDRKSTRLNSSHVAISYAVFCLKKKKQRD